MAWAVATSIGSRFDSCPPHRLFIYFYFMTHLFYFILSICILQEMQNIINPREELIFLLKLKNYKEYKDEEWFTNKAIGKTIMQILYFLIILIGLVSFQWYVFLTMLVVWITKSLLPRTVFIQRMDWIVSASLIVFAILNAYHFHIVI